MSTPQRRLPAWTLLIAFGLQSLLPSTVGAVDLFRSIFKGPGLNGDPCVERLAQEIDWLERHVAQNGSVVCKQPDIWGQARLTKHRDEYEKKLHEQLNQFQVLINGSVAREDQAFLANSFALSAALGNAQQAQFNADLVQTSTQGNFTSSTRQHISMNDFQGNGKISLEPVISLDQLSRYLNHLHELRRINEGDDTADSPGYSLNLVRIPVSVTPGKTTHRGYGAEVTINATPYLNEELLPLSFRNLVINDIVDQLALPITKCAEGKPWEKDAAKRIQLQKAQSDLCQAKEAYVAALGKEAEVGGLVSDTEKTNIRNKIADSGAARAFIELDKLRASSTESVRIFEGVPIRQPEYAAYANAHVRTMVAMDSLAEAEKRLNSALANVATLRSTMNIPVGPSSRMRNANNPVPPSQVVDVFGAEELAVVAKTFAEGYIGRDIRWNDKPPIVHLPDVQRFLQSEVAAAYQCLAREETAWIWHELSNGFNKLPLGDLDIVTVLRHGHADDIACIRREFIRQFRAHSPASARAEVIPHPSAAGSNCLQFGGIADCTCLEALAWAILVESALLNEHLIHDMRSIATLKGCGCMTADGMQFYLPNPGPDERHAFMEYCRCRWPIHVFALDPVTQDQNIADQAAVRRELQLAASLAFASGKINVQNFTKFVRKFESEFQTISLNRTVVGFSHGDDTFGWRFYPRFQTPLPKGNAAALHETVWGPSPKCDTAHLQLEPGMRECTAIVIMPSFVPYMTFEVRSNWFRLTNHHGWLPLHRNTEPTMVDAMKLSRSIQSMHQTAACIRDAGNYRDGEVQRLLARVHQLDRELPLQSMMAQVPIENTLGGFEMFSNGVTDLAPELYGWYGGPGILQTPTTLTCTTCTASTLVGISGTTAVEPIPAVCPCEAGTTLFLVGDHFSVHDTKVIAGDRCIKDVTLLSRQIMRVTIPGEVKPNELDGVKYVDVHVATPYGVTGHLHIPYVAKEEKKEAAPKPSFWRWVGDTEFHICRAINNCATAVVCESDVAVVATKFVGKPTIAIPAGAALKITALSYSLVGADKKETPVGDPFCANLSLSVDPMGQIRVAQPAELRDAISDVVARLAPTIPVDATLKIKATIRYENGRCCAEFPADDDFTLKLKTVSACDRCAGAPATGSAGVFTPAADGLAAEVSLDARAALAQPAADILPADTHPAAIGTIPFTIDAAAAPATPTLAPAAELPFPTSVAETAPEAVPSLPAAAPQVQAVPQFPAASQLPSQQFIVPAGPGAVIVPPGQPATIMLPGMQAPRPTPAPPLRKKLFENCPLCPKQTSLDADRSELRFSDALPDSMSGAAAPLPVDVLRIIGWRRANEPRRLPSLEPETMFDPQTQPAAFMRPLPETEAIAP